MSGQSLAAPNAGVDEMMGSHRTRVVILDFGSQYTHLIARRVRECGVYSEVLRFDAAPSEIAEDTGAIILSGSPFSIYGDDAPKPDPGIYELGIPMLGICYGMQAMTEALGGRVSPGTTREYGPMGFEPGDKHRLFEGLSGTAKVWMSHGDEVMEPPAGFEVLGRSADGKIASIGSDERRFFGLQFHPEVVHTEHGKLVLENYVHEICGIPSNWSPASFVEETVAAIRKQVGDSKVVCALSGGVDSSVMSVLIHRAVGDNLFPIFVDNGVLRKSEDHEVIERLRTRLGLSIDIVDAKGRFLDKLAGVEDPEKKRKIIGNLFIDIFEEEAARLEDVAFLAQGTIYPDVIESAGAKSGKAHVIKSHHNVGGLPDYMKLELVEPLRELFKDEVRKIGVELGLPYEMVYRHPFPGPGLGVRILGEVTKEYADILRQADHIFIEELRNHNLYDQVSQAFAVFLPVRSVGVVGDARQYEYVVSLRAVETVDFMTARFAHLPFDFLDQVSRRIIQEVQGISRVAYDISGKPPATIEWE